MRFIDDQAHRSARLAISQLFLDTELDELDLKSIARELTATGLPVEELQWIYETEVAPACWRNLRALPGGAWSGFDERSLTTAINQHRIKASNLNFWHRLLVRRWTSDTSQQWRQVLALIQSSPDASRQSKL